MIAAGTRLGPYEITGPLGAGGMGEVYRARDTQLNRSVAIKVLPELFAVDAERLGRFTREAQTLAALNHPNIAQIYGLEASGGSTRALVMELVDGEDVSAIIARGPIPLNEAVAIARQIADALDAAHDVGIVHRDLKPANIKVRHDGAVKVLDFGLAKAVAPVEAGGPYDAMNSPTFTSAQMTGMGVILGTAAYMAPEQAKGKIVDKRADIWAFGVVLYEMLSGRRAFDGAESSEVLASVLKSDPDWSALPSMTPPAVRRLLGRCLERDPARRLRDIGDARWELEHIGVEPAAPNSAVHRSGLWISWGLTALVASVAVWALSTRWSPRSDATEGHFAIALPPDAPIVTNDTPIWSQGPLAVSPDGRNIVYVSPSGEATHTADI